MPKRLSFQLFSARMFQPWEPVIEHLAACGYTEVEGFGGAEYGSKGTVFDDPAKFRALLDKHGMTMPTAHLMPLALFEKDMKRVIQVGRTMGVKNFYCPYIMPEDRKHTPAFWKGFGKRMGVVAKAVREEGFGFGWHNHDFEFFKLKDGSYPIDRIFEGGPLLDWEMDIGWTIHAKQNPVKWIKKYGERITSVHVKEFAVNGDMNVETGQTVVGKGKGKWPEIFKALRDHTRCTQFILEHDNPKDYKAWSKASFNYISKI
jgi:sugar phosphate isomerase/epimerase